MLKRQVDTLSPLVEPGFSMERFALAARFYEQLGYQHRFFSSCNDATAIRAAVTCRLQDNVLLGLGTMEDVRCGPTMRDIEAAALQHGIATQVDIHLLNPLDPMLPSFVLGIFPQNGRVDGDTMALRWAIVDDCLAHFGMYVLAHCADGDSAHMSAMRRRQYEVGPTAAAASSSAPLQSDWNDDDDDSDCGNDDNDDSLSSTSSSTPTSSSYHLQPRDRVLSVAVPSLTGGADKRITTAARLVPLAMADGSVHNKLLVDLHVQDPAHKGTKLRSRILGRAGHGVRIGNGRAEVSVLHKAFNGQYALAEARLGLRRDDLDPKQDPMDVPAFLRLVDKDVLQYLNLLSANLSEQASAPLQPAASLPPSPSPAPASSQYHQNASGTQRQLNHSRQRHSTTTTSTSNCSAPASIPADGALCSTGVS
jgi:hypothetical protein